MHQRRAETHQAARPFDQVADERVHRRAVVAGAQRLRLDAMTPAIGFGHVEAATSRVATEVLPEVGELQRRAYGVGAGQGVGGVDAVEMKEEAADRIGRAPAVVEQRGAVGV